MTQFWVANGLYQHLDFMANTPEDGGKYIVNVQIGQQALIGDFPLEEINVIVSQHQKYGMINTTDLATNVNLDKIIPYIYSIGAPVSDADYATLMANNYPPPYKYGSAQRTNGRGKDRLSDKTKATDLFA